jgi:predicted GNAT family N-acyltransferase
MNSIRKPLPRTEQGVEYRAMRTTDLDAAWSLSLDQHWPHRPRDWSTALAMGEGIVVIVDGQLVGTAMRWLWGDTHATIGLVIVSELMRGRRIGSTLMNLILEGLEDRTVCLHATEEGRGLYERLGFVRTGEIRQHQGVASNAPLIALDEGWRLRPLDNSDEPALFELDKRARGWERPQLLRTWLDTCERAMVLDHDGTLDGYAFLRRFGRGVVVGPVVASNDIGARALIGHLIGAAGGRFVRIDLDYDSGLATWMEELQLQRAGTVTAMTRGPRSRDAGGARLFALATQALG